MKIAYITASEILGAANDGGIQCCKRNLSLLKQAFGEENIYVCAITKHKEFVPKSYDNTAVFFSSRSKYSILKNILYGRLQFGKDVEDSVLHHVKSLDCDVAFIEFSRMGYLQKRLPKDIKQVLFIHNIEAEHIKKSMRVHPERIVLKRAFERNEAIAVKIADVIISLNNRDAANLKEYYDRNADLIMPITMEDNYVQADVTKRPLNSPLLKLLFVGSLMPPNEQGITWFVNEVMPRVNTEFTVVGKGFEKLADKLNRSNVKVIGTVEQLSEYYHVSDAVVSPILFGAGMKVKTAEALMYGKPMFATDEALEGYEVDDLENVYRCNTAKAFIESINTYAEKKHYLPYDENIRERFLEKYHTPKYVSVFRELLIEKRVKEI